MRIISQYNSIKIRLFDLSNRGKIARLILFIILYIISKEICSIMINNSEINSLFFPIYESLSIFITDSCCYILRFLYPDIHTTPNHTIVILGQTPIRLYPGCTGLHQMISISLVLFFYPISIKKKLLLWPLSIGILAFASIIHFLILIPISYKFSCLFNFAHNYLTRTVYYSFYFICWILWEKIAFYTHAEKYNRNQESNTN
jgi:exosortase/archaeosortase family protein